MTEDEEPRDTSKTQGMSEEGDPRNFSESTGPNRPASAASEHFMVLDDPVQVDQDSDSRKMDVEQNESEDQLANALETNDPTHDPMYVSRFDLELIENHMRHVGSNAGPFYMSDGAILLGRDIFKKHDKKRNRGLISRVHCSIEPRVDENGHLEYYLLDKSVNGTFLGTHRVDPTGRGARIQHGDVIGLLTSLSGPVESYISNTGGLFKVTLGVRFLRPNLPIATALAGTFLESHTPLTSPLGATYEPGTFVGISPTKAISVPQYDRSETASNASHRSRSSRSTQSMDTTSTNTVLSPPSHQKHDRKSKSSPSKKSKRKSTNGMMTTDSTLFSGHSTDDTDGDDEKDSPEVATPSKQRKPIVTVTKAAYEGETEFGLASNTASPASTPDTSLSPRRSNSKATKKVTQTDEDADASSAASPSKFKKPKSRSRSHSLKVADAKTPVAQPSQNGSGRSASSYWTLSPASRQKRGRSMLAPTKDLEAEEPAVKKLNLSS